MYARRLEIGRKDRRILETLTRKKLEEMERDRVAAEMRQIWEHEREYYKRERMMSDFEVNRLLEKRRAHERASTEQRKRHRSHQDCTHSQVLDREYHTIQKYRDKIISDIAHNKKASAQVKSHKRVDRALEAAKRREQQRRQELEHIANDYVVQLDKEKRAAWNKSKRLNNITNGWLRSRNEIEARKEAARQSIESKYMRSINKAERLSHKREENIKLARIRAEIASDLRKAICNF